MRCAMLRGFVLGAAVFLAPAALVFAQVAENNLEDRVSKLEGNIEQILKLLQQNQKEAASTASSAAASASANSNTPASQTAPPVKTAPGAIVEVWLLSQDFKGSAPEGSPVGKFVDEGPFFEFASFTKQKELQAYSKNRVALRWSGLFKVKEGGVHVFTLDMAKKQTGIEGAWNSHAYSGIWTVALSLNGEAMVAQSPEVKKHGDFTHTAQFEADLQPGLYEFSLLTFITLPIEPAAKTWHNDWFYLKANVREPSSNALRPLTSADLLHKVQ